MHSKSHLAARLTDCPENSDLGQLKQHECFWCKCPKNELGDYVAPDKQYHQRDRNLYWIQIDVNTMGADPELSSRHVPRGFNVFGHIPCIASSFAKADVIARLQVTCPGLGNTRYIESARHEP